MATVADISIGDKISFSSKLPSDSNTYHGEVVGEVTDRIAKTYTEIYTYNNNIRAVDPSVPDPELLSFILIALIDPLENSNKFTIPFAKEWISEPTLNIIATDRVAILEVFDVDNVNANDVVDILRSAGFKSRITELR